MSPLELIFKIHPTTLYQARMTVLNWYLILARVLVMWSLEAVSGCVPLQSQFLPWTPMCCLSRARSRISPARATPRCVLHVRLRQIRMKKMLELR
jgi:hypothetical protein